MSRRFPCNTLPATGQTQLLGEETSHHVLVVVMVPRGEEILLFSKEGTEARARLVGVEGKRALVEILERYEPTERSTPLVLVQALTRKPAWERILRMATELGATEIRGFVGERSVAQGLHRPRWEKILLAAAGQCGRSTPPTLHTHDSLNSALNDLPENTHRYMLTPGADRRPTPTDGTVLLIGPEGGLSPTELEDAAARGFEHAGLGQWTLRADTAAAAALSIYN